MADENVIDTMDAEDFPEIETKKPQAVVHGERRTGEDLMVQEKMKELKWNEGWDPRCPVCQQVIVGKYAVKCPTCKNDVIVHQHCYDAHRIQNHRVEGVVVRIEINQKMDSAGKFSDPVGKWAVSHGQNA